MRGKIARSDPRPSVRVTRGAGSGRHLASVLQEGRENANIDAGLGFIWRISVKLRWPLGLSPQIRELSAGRRKFGALEHSMRIGIQDQGGSSDPIYRLAERTIHNWGLPYTSTVLDLGGGAGHFAGTLINYFEHVHLMDFAPIIQSERIICSSGNLNDSLPYSDATFDAVVSLEVIEHLENPRHFVREIARILKVHGRCLITTPNQVSLASKLCLLLRGQFQQFQDSCYPAHITALLPIDLQRITVEAGLAFTAISYTDDGRIPGTDIRWQVIPSLTGKWFSDNLAVVAVKELPAPL